MNAILVAASICSGCMMGMVELDGYMGMPMGVPITIDIYNPDGNLLESHETMIDDNMMYVIVTDYSGPCNVVAKVPGYLSMRSDNVNLGVATEVDCMFMVMGDTNNDNTVDLFDLNDVLKNFMHKGMMLPQDVNGDEIVDLWDLNTTLINFGMTGQ